MSPVKGVFVRQGRRSEFREIVLDDSTVAHVHCSGTGTDTYVLVHGIGASSRYFRPLAEELSRVGTVFAIDLPGFARTPKPARSLSIPEYAEITWRCLDELSVVRPILVGHSMGAQIVVEMARLRAAARGVVLLGPTVNRVERAALPQTARLAQDTLKEPAKINAIVFSDYLFRCGLVWYIRTLPHMLRHRIDEAIREVRVPTVIVRGIADPIAPRSWVDELAAQCPVAEVAEIAGERHVLMYRSAPEVALLCRKLAAAV
ncbi:alpha/beta hydrolase [Saxibacter everestensis]|uniref:Alpha/beta hydrolase n=1 Tax=Saxibacter everestensis TaxID=2909229 RepID=A0ABY8QTX0_9MICO|nr:alpha/beta hydrolase [Brevibacteriaceae bacterium ZFBP1038]